MTEKTEAVAAGVENWNTLDDEVTANFDDIRSRRQQHGRNPFSLTAQSGCGFDDRPPVAVVEVQIQIVCPGSAYGAGPNQKLNRYRPSVCRKAKEVCGLSEIGRFVENESSSRFAWNLWQSNWERIRHTWYDSGLKMIA